MRLRSPTLPIWSLLVLGIMLRVSPVSAAQAVVRDGNTIQLGDITYRLDGVDAPELDQVCIDSHADPYGCGIEARKQLRRLIGGRAVHCDDLGPDRPRKKRHLAICSVEGDPTSLNERLVRTGFAIDLEPAAKLHLKEDADTAKADGLGLWKGCFAAPREFRSGKKDGALLGASCRADRDREIRSVLFPERPAMPPRCSIKAKFAVRARITGHVGIYFLQGCPSYAGVTRPDRWFCSEDDAQAEGFRRAFNCRAGHRK